MDENETRQIHVDWPIVGLLGKTIKGIIAKKNAEGSNPHMLVFLVCDDDSAIELYSGGNIDFSDILQKHGMDAARKYISPPMEILLDVELDSHNQLIAQTVESRH